MRWYAGSDHAGFQLKQALVKLLREQGDEVIDVGTNDESSCDYPAFGAEVGRRVVADQGTLGLIVCGTGIGISIAANKVPGVRAALAHDAFTAEKAREHNDANVVSLGARVVGQGVAEQAVLAFRNTPYAGGRHQKRVEMITALESR